MDRWKAYKLKCESGESGPSVPGPNKYILEHMKEYCKLKQNKVLPYLNRSEGGLGGNDEANKQIRFRDYRLCRMYGSNYIDNDIIMNEITNGEKEFWTYEELDDIIYGFIKTATEYMDCDWDVTGHIELKNRRGYDS
jgi:hypothetical protein